ncbi:hypothetical protein Tco_1253320 [Tanacetum coccineum]
MLILHGIESIRKNSSFDSIRCMGIIDRPHLQKMGNNLKWLGKINVIGKYYHMLQTNLDLWLRNAKRKRLDFEEKVICTTFLVEAVTAVHMRMHAHKSIIVGPNWVDVKKHISLTGPLNGRSGTNQPDGYVDPYHPGTKVIMEYLVKVDLKARILELKQRYFEDYYSKDQYAVSIKEDTAYLCLHSPKTSKTTRSNTPYPGKAIRRIQAIWE